MGTWGERFCCAKVMKLPRMMFQWELGYIDINEKNLLLFEDKNQKYFLQAAELPFG